MWLGIYRPRFVGTERSQDPLVGEGSLFLPKKNLTPALLLAEASPLTLSSFLTILFISMVDRRNYQA